MISMKLETPETIDTTETDGQIEYVNEWVDRNNVSWSPRREINLLKKALKQDYLYSDEELRKMKSRLRDMYIVNKQLKRGPGFGKY